MGVFINSGNGYQPVKVAEKIDFEPVENVSNLEPSNKGELNLQVTEADDDFEPVENVSNLEPSNKGELNLQVTEADDDFEFIKSLVPDEEETRKKAHSLLQAAAGRIKDGERKIIECPNCGHKVYALREGRILRVNCGGCNIDASAEYLSELKINIPKSHI